MFYGDTVVFRNMEKIPEEEVILARESESIQFRIESTEDSLEDTPFFLFNGTSENVGDVFGVSGGENVTESYQAPVHFEENGNHVVHAVWHTEGADMMKYNSIDEIRNDPKGRVVEWSVYVLDEDSDLDDVRQVIDDLIRVGTVAWAGKELRNMLKDRMSDSGDDSDCAEEDSTDDFQEVLTNFE